MMFVDGGAPCPVFFLIFSVVLSISPTQSASTSPPILSSNITHLLQPFSNDVVASPPQHPSDPLPSSSPFFKDTLKEIAKKEKWRLEDIRRVSGLDAKKVKFGDLQRYEFRVPFGGRRGSDEFVFKLFDQVSSWKRFPIGENVSDFEALLTGFSSKAVLPSLQIRGPFHLHVADGHHHQLNLHLPFNHSFPGLKHIFVGEGIIVEVKGAEEVSFVHFTELHEKFNRSACGLGYLWPPLCMAWPSIRIVGSATVVAYRTRSPESFIETAFLSNTTIELLPEKCYSRHMYQIWDRGSLNFLSARIALLENVLRTFVGHKTHPSTNSGSVKVKITASSIFRFQLELEREILRNDTYWSTVADWRTKPTGERVWFEVSGRLEAKVFKPLTIKKVRPFIEVDSKAWSNLLSNISFTKFPSFLVPQEALTLDVKW